MGKYDPWDDFFTNLEGSEVRFDLDRFEELSGVELPPSAREHPSWWASAQYHAKWALYGWRATPRLGTNEVIFQRVTTEPTVITETTPPNAADAQQETSADLLLMGCVATKRHETLPAKDLYASALWQKRRAYAEASGKPWFILSAEYGLVAPDEVIEPYDRYMGSQPHDYRLQWSRLTADAVISQARELGAGSVEIHAGAAYTDHGLEKELRRAGLEVIRPLRGLRQGEQLAWYDQPTKQPRRQPAPDTPAPQQQRPGSGLVQITSDHVHRLADIYRSGVLGESWDQLPEAWNLPDGAPQEQRQFLTFVAAVDRARDAASLWAAAHRLWDSEPWMYRPRGIVARPFVELSEALRRYGVSQRHSVDSNAWRSIAEALASADCPPAITSAIEGEPVSAQSVLREVQQNWPHGTPMFPLLRGPKISAMWVRMLAFPGGSPISDVEVIPVAVDTHVQRVTEMLGLVPVRELNDRHRAAIQDVWFTGVRRAGSFGAPGGIDGTAAGIDPALWAIGKEACSRCESSRRKITVGDLCDSCVLGRITS